MLFRPAGSKGSEMVVGANGSPVLNLPRPNDVPNANDVFLSSLVQANLPINRHSSAGSPIITSLPLMSIRFATQFLSRLANTMNPQWVNGGHQLNAYDRDLSGVVGPSML